MCVPARPARKVFETVLHVKNPWSICNAFLCDGRGEGGSRQAEA